MIEGIERDIRGFYIQWDSTNKCNLLCSHCYHNSGKDIQETPKGIMSLDETKSMVDDLKQTCERWEFRPTFTISGGEPLLRSDLPNIIEYTYSRGIRTNILSNGTLITSEIAKHLKDFNISVVQISIDGNREVHNKIRGRNWAYDSAMEGIRECRDNGIHVTISHTLMKSNVYNLEDVVSGAIKSHANGIGFQTLVPNPLLGEKDPEFLNCQEMKKAYDQLSILRKKYSDKIDIYQSEVLWHLYNPQLIKDSHFYQGGCSAGFTGLSVLSDGVVYACRRLPIKIGHIGEGVVRLVTESSLMQKLREYRKDQNKFCDSSQHCGGCRAVAYATTGDPFSKDPSCFKHLI
jgi:AdoMet-dependent heme synthase